MARPVGHVDYDIPWETPEEQDGIRFYHDRELPKLFNDDRFTIGGAPHRVTSLCLWLWARDSTQSEPTEYPKEELMSAVFPRSEIEMGNVSKHTVGRLLSYSLRYSPRFQQVRKGKTTMCWRIRHPLEIRYGMEHNIAVWYAQFCVYVAKTHESVSQVGPEEMRSFLWEELRDADPQYVSEFFGRNAGA